MSKYHANELLNDTKQDRVKHWKYVKKIPVGKGYRYFYTLDEYRAYLKDPNAEYEKAKDAVKVEIGKSKKTAKEISSRGQKKAKEIISSRSNKNVSINVAKLKNSSRGENFKKKMNDLAKKASKKWDENKESVKKSVNSGKEWVKNKVEEFKEKREAKKKEKERKKKEEKKKKELELERKREKLAKKYKYISRIKINGKYCYFYSQEEIDNWNKKQEYIKNEPSFMKNVKHSEFPYSIDEDVIQVNPKHNFYDFDERYEYNCSECTAIYELRRRGYDVESNGESGLGANHEKYNTDKRFELFYEDPKINRFPPAKNDSEAYRQLENTFAEMPPGSRGDLSFQWKDGGGHSIAWEKDSKGNLHLIDTQLSGHGNKIEYKSLESLSKQIDGTTSYRGIQFRGKDTKGLNSMKEYSGTTITRTDNLELRSEIKNICRDTNDRKRTKPNTDDAWEFIGENTVRSRTMTEEEIVKRYSNLSR